jgi:hypothetical protein
MTPSKQSTTFSFAPAVDPPRPEPIKWTTNASKYEVYVPILSSFGNMDLIAHAVAVRTKVLSSVGTVAHRGPALYELYPRSLPFVLLSEWEQLNSEADQAETVDNTTTIVNFDARLREFIEAHATADFRYELAQFLRSCHKPMNLPVHTFSYKLREFNSYIEWIPGTKPKLNDQQLKQAFHDAMPPTWRDRFANAGNTVTTLSMPQLLQYFRTQEEQAARKMLENNQQQRQRVASHRRDKKDDNLHSKKKDKPNGKILKKEKRTRIANDVPCPIHPGMGHTWGTCRANAFNEERLAKRPKRENKNTNSMIASVAQMAINDAPSAPSEPGAIEG